MISICLLQKLSVLITSSNSFTRASKKLWFSLYLIKAIPIWWNPDIIDWLLTDVKRLGCEIRKFWLDDLMTPQKS